MQVQCDRCGGATQPKNFKYKDPNRGTFTKYVCQGNCMDGQFKHSCFAPKTPNTTTPAASKPTNGNASGVGAEMITELREIRKLLQTLVQLKTGKVQIAETELQPDQEIPF